LKNTVFKLSNLNQRNKFMNYKGVIIEESLAKIDVLKDLVIVDTKVELVTEALKFGFRARTGCNGWQTLILGTKLVTRANSWVKGGDQRVVRMSAFTGVSKSATMALSGSKLGFVSRF